MNVILFLPGLLVILFRAVGAFSTIMYMLTIVGGLQCLLGLPFLIHNPKSYVYAAFDFSRSFLYEWTVNWRFLDEKIFLHPSTSKLLLFLHLNVLCLFGIYRWTGLSSMGLRWIATCWHGDPVPMSSSFMILTLFTSNLIGITFARSLHYQFFSWYFHQIPLLAWASSWPLPIRLALPLAVEFAWNVFPSTNLSSVILLIAHIMLLVGLWTRRARTPIHQIKIS